MGSHRLIARETILTLADGNVGGTQMSSSAAPSDIVLIPSEQERLALNLSWGRATRATSMNTYVSHRISLYDNQLHENTCPPPTASL